ncbi:MAG: class F sortase [Arachnia sp.]
MSHIANPSRRPAQRTLLLTIAALLVAALLVTAGWAFFGNRPEAPTAASTPSSSSPVSTTPAPSPSSTPSPSTTPSCTTADGEFVPTSFSIEGFGDDYPVVALNLDEHGNIAAPPKNESHAASWWSGGPKPGSAAGKAVLSVHTYRSGGALGNEMYSDDGPSIKPGDIIRLTADGKVQCYEFTDATKMWVKDYDPSSDAMVDFDGDPQLLIIICWDFDPATENWDSRIFFHATPVK